MTSPSLEKSLPYYEQVYHSIKQMIVKGVFQPGERIYEAKMAREFNVSRSPVREAVRSLVTDGLLVVDDKSQITVYHPSMEDVEDIYQCRMVLESLATKLATQRSSDAELEVIGEKLQMAEELLINNSSSEIVQQLVDLNGEFHYLIQRSSGNKRLQKQLQGLYTLAYYYRIKNFNGQDRASVILKEHRTIFQCMAEREASKAALAMEEHIRNDLVHLKNIILSESKEST